MAEITRWSQVGDVQREQTRLTGKADWMDKYFWIEFTKLRRTFLDLQTSVHPIADSPRETERLPLIEAFKEWVKDSNEWWAGDWVDYSRIADWHVNQYINLMTRKKNKQSLSPLFLQLISVNAEVKFRDV